MNRIKSWFFSHIDDVIIIITLLFVSALEIFLINRKFGVFTGGFGSSIVVDNLREQLWFVLAYLLAQGLFAILLWSFARFLTLKLPRWTTAVIFSLLMLQTTILLLTVKFQLHSYFSDALSFTLVKNLGGGSVVDALLFVFNEVAVSLFVIVIMLLINLLCWRLLKQRLHSGAKRQERGLLLPVVAISASFIVCAFMVPRVAGDTQHGLSKTLAYQTGSVLLNAATDFDADGYGLFHHLYDKAPFDGDSYPYSIELHADNSISIGGFNAKLQLEKLTPLAVNNRFSAAPPHVVVVVIESTRSDVIGKRLHGKPVAPHLEALVQGGSLASPNFSHVGFTTYSLKSLFSGELLPDMLSPSLFDDFKKNGYKIGVFSGQPESFGNISATVRMKQNADIYVDAETLKDKRAFSFAAKGSLLVDEQHLLKAFDSHFSEARQWQQPVFLYFNFQSPHFPYHHPDVALNLIKKPIKRDDISIKNKDLVAETYWNVVAHSDQQLGALVAKLKQLGVWQNTLLFVTSDHGEELYDEGFLGHGHVINYHQNATFLVSNKANSLPPGPVSLSDFRSIVLGLVNGTPQQQVAAPPFMYVGGLARPNQIGLAGQQGTLTTLKFESRMVCFVEQQRCSSYDTLEGDDAHRATLLLQRWASELVQRQQQNSLDIVKR